MAAVARIVVTRMPSVAVQSVCSGQGKAEGGCDRSRLSQRSAKAISAATAPKDIWKLGPSRASGSRSRTMIAASARLRMLSAARSTRIAPSMTSVMISERSVATSPPEKTQ